MSSPTPGAVGANSWSSDFSTGDFSQWTWWGQGQANIWGDISVVNPGSVGVPALDPSDPHIAQMTVTASGPADGQVNAKLYKMFGSTDNSGVEHPPSDVSGTYSAWYYIPSSYQMSSSDTWANIFQFKEQYAQADGSSHSDPLWWIQLSSGAWAASMGGARWIGAKPTSSEQPVAVLNRWNNDWKRQVVLDTVPLNRWFEIVAVVHQNDRIDFSIDGQPFDTAQASEYPVSPFHSSSQEWIFGVGNYSTAPNTTLYIGRASYGATG